MKRALRFLFPAGLLPKEHGAYAELVFPLLSVLVLGSPGPTSLLFTSAIVGGFLGHEPTLVLLGRRGSRVQRQLGPRARTQLGALIPLTLASGIGALVLASPATRTAALAGAPALALVAWLVAKGQEKTLPGELLVALAFSGAAIPVGLAGGLALEIALVVCAAWLEVFTAGVLVVHGMLRRAKRDAPALARVVTATSSLLVLVALGLTSAQLLAGHRPWAVVFVPGAAASAAVLLAGLGPKELRRVGWSLVASNVLTLVALLGTLYGSTSLAPLF